MSEASRALEVSVVPSGDAKASRPAPQSRVEAHGRGAPRTLDRAAPGAVVRVIGVDGDDALARRLEDLGFWRGSEVRVDRVAPFGDPVQFRLHGYRLALRKSEAKRVLVEDG